ncbi:hypothetical protein [Pseudovibrio sp. SPO723]|uniref:hypothetical protein n=1 Tax=Nesiotobacter zosterae TaxID=392721 RepID=UPI0029CA5CF7|nr:hypothetical protein [Pseudovibrio sp. SPO723]
MFASESGLRALSAIMNGFTPIREDVAGLLFRIGFVIPMVMVNLARLEAGMADRVKRREDLPSLCFSEGAPYFGSARSSSHGRSFGLCR